MENQNKSHSNLLFKYVPFEKNSIMHLVLFLASCYIILHLVIIVFLILSDAPKNAYEVYILPNTGIKDWLHFLQKPWVVLTYALGQKSFFTLMTNLLWLYIFGSIIQQQTSHKEILVMFFTVYIVNGILYVLFTSFFPETSFSYVLNTLPAVVSYAFASLALNPQRKIDFKLSSDIPLWIFVLVFMLLLILSVQGIFSIVAGLYFIAAFVGWAYGKWLKAGHQPGDKILSWIATQQAKVGGKDEKIDGWDVEKLGQSLRTNRPDVPEEVVQNILKKLKKGGLGALTMHERGILISSK